MRTIGDPKPSPRCTSTTASVLVLLAAALGAGGCSGESQAGKPGGASSSGGVSSDGMSRGPAFLAATRIWDNSSTTSYFHVLPSIEQGTAVDLTQALEVPGSAKLYASEELGWFAIGDGESPTISSYTLDDHNALVKGVSISLQPYGVQDLWPTLYFISPTKAYYPDRAGKQLIILNPKTMEVQGSIKLPQTARDGYLSLYGYTAIQRGKTLLFSVGWFDWEKNDTVLGETGLVLLDTETDTVKRFDVDKRCGGITQANVTASGDTYFVSSALAGAAHRLSRLLTEPCALRVQKDADAFDQGYIQHLGELTAGAIAGEPVPGVGDSLFLRTFDESLATIKPDNKTWDLTGQKAWRWWRWDTAKNQAVQVSEMTPSPADVLWFQVDNRVFGAETKEDNSETTLLELTANGGPKTALKAPGFLYGLAKVR